jgi:hypothetical protein
LWGGYWNQAYYPSKINAYMPAQNESNQIPVPVFRMLGSDPVRQYDNGLGTDRQGVITLEPVYKDGGGDSSWVNWFFKEFVEGEALEFGYTQAGQENSFTWDAMSKGLEIQFPLIARLRDEKKVKVETLAGSGSWFRAHYKITPATSVTINRDLKGSDRKTVWFNSRFYRINLEWENGTLRFRDIHLFNERLASPYLTEKLTSTSCSFFTLPFVDGYIWSTPQKIAGLRFKAFIGGKETPLEGGDPTVTNPSPGKLHISWPLKPVDDTLVMNIDERQIKIDLVGEKARAHSLNWFLDLTVSGKADLPFKEIKPRRIGCEFQHMKYWITATKGAFSKPNDSTVLRMRPEMNSLILNLAERNGAVTKIP